MRSLKGSLGLLILLAAIGLLAWRSWPLPAGQASVDFSPAILQALDPQTKFPDYLFDEKRILSIKYPAVIRRGVAGWIVLDWRVNNDTVEIGAEQTGGTENVLIETRLDLVGITQNPTSSIDAPLIAGRTASMQWQLHPGQAGVYNGTVWSYLNPAPDLTASAGNQNPSTGFMPVAAQDIQIRVISLLGMDITQVSWAAAICLVLGFGMLVWTLSPPGRRARRKEKKGEQ